MIDEKMTNITQKISTLKKYKRGLIKSFIAKGKTGDRLSSYVSAEDKTKLPSSFGKSEGKYPFFINNSDGISKYCDEYRFDGMYLILNTGGCSSVKLYQGKFSAMSDCLVLKPKSNPIGIYYFLKSIEGRIDYVGFQGTGLRHLDQDWLLKQKVTLPSIDEAKLQFFNIEIDMRIEALNEKSESLLKMKRYLLSKLFI